MVGRLIVDRSMVVLSTIRVRNDLVDDLIIRRPLVDWSTSRPGAWSICRQRQNGHIGLVVVVTERDR